MVRRLVVSSSDSYDKKEDKIQTKEDIYAKNLKKFIIDKAISDFNTISI